MLLTFLSLGSRSEAALLFPESWWHLTVRGLSPVSSHDYAENKTPSKQYENGPITYLRGNYRPSRPYLHTSPPWSAAYAEIWEIRGNPGSITRAWVEDAAPQNPLLHLWTVWRWSQEKREESNWRKCRHCNKANYGQKPPAFFFRPADDAICEVTRWRHRVPPRWSAYQARPWSYSLSWVSEVGFITSYHKDESFGRA